MRPRWERPDTNNLLNPLQVQAHMSGSACWRRHACGRRRRMSAWRRRGSHGQKPPTEKTACYQLSWSINSSNNSCTSLEEMFKLCSLRPGFSFSEHSLFSSVIGPANILWFLTFMKYGVCQKPSRDLSTLRHRKVTFKVPVKADK